MSFISRLETRSKDVDSLLCIGLDPHPDDLTENSGEAAKAFCLQLIDATLDLAAAYKPNIAFFEALGPQGMTALKDVIAAVPEDVLVILDAKRGDISSTARAYAQAVFETLGADAVTLSPYLGFDSIEPFISDTEHGGFVLCKTSNPGAADLQDLLVISDPEETSTPIPLFIRMAQHVGTWNTRDNLGLVVGATQPDSLTRVREVVPDLWILAPGIGAQGGNLKVALEAGLREDGLGMLIPVSRGISRAVDPRKAAVELRDSINQIRREKLGNGLTAGYLPSYIRVQSGSDDVLKLADDLLYADCIKFGKFTLKSGIESPIYIDLRRLVGYPQLLKSLAKAYIQILQELQFDHLGALPYAALPIASAISLQGNYSMVYPRKEVKTYGTKADVEGVFKPKDVVVVIDDLISTGGSKFEGIEKLTSAGLCVKDIVVLIDRSPDGGQELVKAGYHLHAVLSLPQILDHYEKTDAIQPDMINATRIFLQKQ